VNGQVTLDVFAACEGRANCFTCLQSVGLELCATNKHFGKNVLETDSEISTWNFMLVATEPCTDTRIRRKRDRKLMLEGTISRTTLSFGLEGII